MKSDTPFSPAKDISGMRPPRDPWNPDRAMSPRELHYERQPGEETAAEQSHTPNIYGGEATTHYPIKEGRPEGAA